MACTARDAAASWCSTDSLALGSGIQLGSPHAIESSAEQVLQLNLSAIAPRRSAHDLSAIFDHAMCSALPVEFESHDLSALGSAALTAFKHAFRARLKNGEQQWGRRVVGSNQSWVWAGSGHVGAIYAHPIFKLSGAEVEALLRRSSAATHVFGDASARMEHSRDAALHAVLQRLLSSVHRVVFPLVGSLMERGLRLDAGAITEALVFERAIIHYYDKDTPPSLLLTDHAFHVDDDLFT